MEKSGVKSRRGFTHTCKTVEVSELEETFYKVLDIFAGDKTVEVENELNKINDEQLDLFKEKYPDAEWGETDGIIWVRIEKKDEFTVWVKSRPGIIVQVEKLEDAPWKLKDVIQSIDDWLKY